MFQFIWDKAHLLPHPFMAIKEKTALPTGMGLICNEWSNNQEDTAISLSRQPSNNKIQQGSTLAFGSEVKVLYGVQVDFRSLHVMIHAITSRFGSLCEYSQ